MAFVALPVVALPGVSLPVVALRVVAVPVVPLPVVPAVRGLGWSLLRVFVDDLYVDVVALVVHDVVFSVAAVVVVSALAVTEYVGGVVVVDLGVQLRTEGHHALTL